MCSEVRVGRREGVGAIAASGMHGEGPTGDWGAGHAQERTSNMRSMLVTLDVSKLSGWLNATACCRVERRGRSMRRKVRLGRRAGVGRLWGGGGASGMCTRRVSDSKLGAQGTRGAHPEHVDHVRDAGRVEDQRLVERRRALPRVERRGYGAG